MSVLKGLVMPRGSKPPFDFDFVRSAGSQARGAYSEPYICCYSHLNLDLIRRSESGQHTAPGHAELFLDVKPAPTDDYFRDPPPGVRSPLFACALSGEGRGARASTSEIFKCLGQPVVYAVEIMARQPRVFLFSISMFGSLARLIRWDRAGAVMTRAFDIRQDGSLLHEFFQRFLHASDAGRGHDLSYKLASPQQEALFFRTVEARIRQQSHLQGHDLQCALREHYEPGKVYTVDVLQLQSSSQAACRHQYMVSRPVVSPRTLAGRGTRGYWAVDSSTNALVFIKDTWRDLSLEVMEGKTLELLTSLGVRYIPSVVGFGDVQQPLPGWRKEDVHIQRVYSRNIYLPAIWY